MSMNIHISATRKITFKKKDGKRSGGIQTEVFDAFQTPTEDTYKIVKSGNTAQAYIDWVLSVYDKDEDMVIYADDDIWGEKDPVRVEVYNVGKEHVEEFKAWMTRMDEDGYTVKFEVI